ncbi:Ldh family oxidoreductase [Rhodococcus koreensis]|uniref:(2R)-3-sulfolactate dehydrogenase (NADP+) n=1 Tax=Rhodococcus koreensis TaxID=99653 RepID=A0A1H4L4S7_9NOCA|nr:Ldh family oxidoreductase [Rhodococcus koreensis]SEB65767.1 (2R)-3-sulfolactate dehydrogenase (NADP+) [Rhodococcus koreensis]
MSPLSEVAVPREEIARIARTALQLSGASTAVADLLVDAALFAEDRGMRGVGVAHLLDYLHAIDAGRLDGNAVPRWERVAPGFISCDAQGGTFHAGFDAAFDELVTAAQSLGVAVFVQSGAFAGGQLGWFTERLSTHGLVALGAINSNALLATAPGTGRVLGTNPMSYSFPRMEQQVMTVDQSSSAAAYVNVRDAAARGEQIPEGWAVDAAGEPTVDSEAALEGAMLPFGGYKGANIAWMVELLAGMSGANWSIDAPSFDSGSEHPGVGMFILALDASKLQNDFVARADAHVVRLSTLGVRPPGTPRMLPLTEIQVRADVLDQLSTRAGRAVQPSTGGR